MRENRMKKPLYRKVNTKTHGVRHNFGGEFKDVRHKLKDSDVQHSSMGGKIERGLDYTPLFKFLISKVGQSWDNVYGEAIGRLDKEEPIFWLVHTEKTMSKQMVQIGVSSYFSGLYIDDDKKLQFINPNLTKDDLIPKCTCCTHTFNGETCPPK